MTQDPLGSSDCRSGAPERRLGESAERDGEASARLFPSLRRILAAPADTAALLALVAAERPAFDSAVVLVRDGGRWRAGAALGIDPNGLPLERFDPAAFVEAARVGTPLQIRGDDIPAVLPAGTLAALLLPFASPSGSPDCVILFGSRSVPGIDEHDAVLARVAGERLARLVDAARLEAQSADADDARRRTGGFRDQVLAIVGHDLRNPLGAIVMSASLLQRRGNLGGWQARAVERVRASAGRMGRIIDDLLSYTRTRLGPGIPVAPRPADLGEIVRKIVDEVRVVHPQATVEVERVGDLSGTWDPARLEQVMSNLLSNAIDHGEEGSTVRVGVCGSSGEVGLAVMNEGEIPTAVLEHAFEAFHRCPEQDARKASGLGLGLYIAREIVRRHGGDISVRSGDGRTHVIVTLPRAAGGAENAGAQPLP